MENYNNMNQNDNQTNNQQQYGYQSGNQALYGYQQSNQAQYNSQQNNQTQYNYQQTNQMQYVDQSYQQMQYANQPVSQPVNQKKKDKPGNSGGPKKKKTGLIIALIVTFAVLLIGAGVTAAYFYMTEKKNKEAASTTASEFIKAYGYHDLTNLQNFFPDQLKKVDEVIDFTDESKYDGVKYYGYTIKDVEVTDVQKYSVDSAADGVADAYNKHLDVENSYWVSVKYTETYDKDGAAVENTLTDNVICGKIDEQWYVLDPQLISKKNETIANFDKEADDDQSKDVAQKFMTCLKDSDIDGMGSYASADIWELDSTKESKEALTDSFDKMSEFDITYTVSDATVSDPEECDVTEAKNSVKKEYEIEPSFDKCRKITADYSVTIEADGETTTKDVTEEFICGKEDGKWYVYNSDILTDHNALFVDIIAEKETERDEEEVRATIEAFVESLAVLDIDTMKSYMPDVALNNEDIASTIETLESQKTQFDSYGVVLTLDSVEIGTITEENAAALMLEVVIEYSGAILNIEKAYSTTVTFSRSASLMGRTQSDEIKSDMICAKIDGKWYILQASIHEEE